MDIDTATDQLLTNVQSLFGKIGSFAGSFASGAASTFGWIAFIVLISFFVLSETGGNPERFIHVSIPGHQEDVKKMGSEMSRIWNAFLRGQMILMVLTVIIYTALLGSLGVRFFYGLALIAGLARFVPYLGPTITWIIYSLVCLFQARTVFGLSPVMYTVLVVGLSLIIDGTIDAMVTPRILGGAMKVHPAGVLIAAFVGVNILGVVGVVLAAPVLASLLLLSRYSMRKLFDLDPWENMEKISSDVEVPSVDEHIQKLFLGIKNKLSTSTKKAEKRNDIDQKKPEEHE